MAWLGVAVGALLGLVFSALGAGGALLAVPALKFIFGATLTEATAGGLMVVWAAATTGAVAHARAGRVVFPVVLWLGGASMLGAPLGAKLHHLVPERLTLGLFAAVVLLALGLMSRRPADQQEPTLRSTPRLLLPVGFALGVGVGFLGVGGGFLLVPLLTSWARLSLRVAIGTSTAIIALTSLAGALSHVLVGSVALGSLFPMGAGAVAGAWVGAQLAGKLPERPLRLAFLALALVVALRMGWAALVGMP